MSRQVNRKPPKGVAPYRADDPVAVLAHALHRAEVGCRAGRCVLAEHETDATRLALVLSDPAAPGARRLG
jgi:hypothetical protein